jgi:hypothetical protein
LSITSATKECGKTRLLEVLSGLVSRPWLTGRVTAAVLARKVDKERPTLLLDESDSAFSGEREYAEALRGILNSGYRRSGRSSVCVGQGVNISYVDLSTFCPKAIAGIGHLPDTVASRSIPIRLKKIAPDEQVAGFYLREFEGIAALLHQALVSLGQLHVAALDAARPERPRGLKDRAADCWEPLLAIAELAGEDWPERARSAAIELSSEGARDDDSLGVELLADCHAVFDGQERMFTDALVAALCEDVEKPWATWHRGERISPRSLGRLLKPFGISSRTIRIGNETAKGYLRESFEDAWKRWLPSNPPDLSVTTSQPASAKGLRPFSIRHTTPLVTDNQTPANPHGERDVTDVTDRNGGYGRNGAPALGDEGFPELILLRPFLPATSPRPRRRGATASTSAWPERHERAAVSCRSPRRPKRGSDARRPPRARLRTPRYRCGLSRLSRRRSPRLRPAVDSRHRLHQLPRGAHLRRESGSSVSQ